MQKGKEREGRKGEGIEQCTQTEEETGERRCGRHEEHACRARTSAPCTMRSLRPCEDSSSPNESTSHAPETDAAIDRYSAAPSQLAMVLPHRDDAPRHPAAHCDGGRACSRALLAALQRRHRRRGTSARARLECSADRARHSTRVDAHVRAVVHAAWRRAVAAVAHHRSKNAT